jgi:hypothetical protein
MAKQSVEPAREVDETLEAAVRPRQSDTEGEESLLCVSNIMGKRGVLSPGTLRPNGTKSKL